jgi:hypothetical protein
MTCGVDWFAAAQVERAGTICAPQWRTWLRTRRRSPDKVHNIRPRHRPAREPTEAQNEASCSSWDGRYPGLPLLVVPTMRDVGQRRLNDIGSVSDRERDRQVQIAYGLDGSGVTE